jgi:hypothetical protein
MSSARKTPSPKTPSEKSAEKAKKAPRKSPAPRPDEMSEEVLEFITAIDEYKRKQQRPFPSWSEILEVLKTLGYSREEDE